MAAHFPFRIVLALILAPMALFGQIGLSTPVGVQPTNDFEIYATRGFMVQQKYQYVATDPNASIDNLSCVSPAPNLTALAGILKDPNGDANYTAGIIYSCVQSINLNSIDAQILAGGVINGIELTVEELGTEGDASDRLLIQDENGNRVANLYGTDWVGSQFITRGATVKITFIADGDGNVGVGFRLRWRALVQQNPDPNVTVRRPFGTSLYFDIFKGALRTGYLDQTQNGYGTWSFAAGHFNEVPGTSGGAIGSRNDVFANSSVALGASNHISAAAFHAATIGNSNTIVSPYSLALGDRNHSGAEAAITAGRSNTAVAEAALALGKQNSASGVASVALGLSNTTAAANTLAGGRSNRAIAESAIALGALNLASGLTAVAIGRSNTASANESVAIGQDSQATGENGIAIGRNTQATGQGSTAMGNTVSTNAFRGAYIIGDDSGINAPTLSTTTNQFTARFAGGFRMITAVNGSGVPTAGVSLTTGGTSWATLSDSTQKELFRPINGPDLLQKIGEMKLTTWNYKDQRGIRHYGPMAQEFFSLFGRDALGTIGTDKLITTQDIEGLTLTAVQALVRENEQLKGELRQLKADRNAQSAQTTRLENRLNTLEATLLPKRAAMSPVTAKSNRR